MSNRKGILAELKFKQEAISRKLFTADPTYPQSRYDLILDNGNDMYRVQIKSTNMQKEKGGVTAFEVALLGGNKTKKYTKNEVDFFGVYLDKFDVWYIIPFDAVADIKYLSLFPFSKNSKYEIYRNAWRLLSSS